MCGKCEAKKGSKRKIQQMMREKIIIDKRIHTTKMCAWN